VLFADIRGSTALAEHIPGLSFTRDALAHPRLVPGTQRTSLKKQSAIPARRCNGARRAHDSHKKRDLPAAQLHRSALLCREFICYRRKNPLAKEHLSSGGEGSPDISPKPMK